MRILILVLLVFTLAVSTTYSQVVEVHPRIGISPYHHPETSTYRLLAGVGLNAANYTAMPLVEFAQGSVREGTNLFSGSVIESRSNSRLPRTAFTEFDLLYGYAYEYEYSSVGTRPVMYHFAISSGVALDTYSERWRRPRRGVIDTSFVRPNVFDYSAGLPIQAQAFFEPGRYVGLGVVAYANISKFQPKYGLLLGVEARY